MMRDRLLLGLRRFMIPLPRMIWHRSVASDARRARGEIGFMSEDHHRVRDWAVLELPRAGAPLSPESIAEPLGLEQARVVAILDELERHLKFVYRNERGEITWAYPVTVDETPHHARFSTGEDVYSP